jgi:hypothetical protein
MKNRKVILLGALVVAIWGYIGYKIVSGMGEETYGDLPLVVRTRSVETKKVEPYSLVLSYPDPFLKKTQPSNSKATPKAAPRKLRKEEPPKVIVNIRWERLSFEGAVYNTSRNSVVAMISIDGVEHMLKKNESIDDFTISEIYRDSIKVDALGFTKYIKRKK